jgi:hypothetical protein
VWNDITIGEACPESCGLCDDGSGWDGDACTMPDHSIHITSSGSVLYHSSTSIAGFQFTVDGGTVLGASGGDADTQGFIINTGTNNVVLGFTLTGTYFNGCGTMVEVEMEGNATGLSGIIVSDSEGEELPIEYFDGSNDGGDVEGCMDMDACNYNADATVDDGSCVYAEDNYDCNGNCTVGEDCAGECGGSAEVDECGVCGGDGSTCGESNVSLEIQNVDINAGILEIYMVNSEEVGGFQFELTGITITSAIGPEGFIISTSSNMILGFSLTGATIPVGSAVLTTVSFVDYLGGEICFGEDTGSSGSTVIGDANGEYVAPALV